MGFMGFPSLTEIGVGEYNRKKAEDGQREQNVWSADQAQKQMDFEERMSNTSFQRSTADMRKAGLNPMLAIMKGGASTPSGAMGQGQSVGGAGTTAFSQSRKSTPDTRLAIAQVGQINSAAAVNRAQARKIKAETVRPEAFNPIWETVGTTAKKVKENYFNNDKPFFTPGKSYLDKKVLKYLKGSFKKGPNKNPRSQGFKK